jgi:hypothetical protein
MQMPNGSDMWGPDGHSLLVGKSPRRSGLSVIFAHRFGRAFGAIIKQLVNGNVGGTATATHTRILAKEADGSFSGARTIETVNLVNRATTAADQTEISNVISRDTSAYTRDLSGNGSRG